MAIYYLISESHGVEEFDGTIYEAANTLAITKYVDGKLIRGKRTYEIFKCLGRKVFANKEEAYLSYLALLERARQQACKRLNRLNKLTDDTYQQYGK